MTIAVDLGRKVTNKQTKFVNFCSLLITFSNFFFFLYSAWLSLKHHCTGECWSWPGPEAIKLFSCSTQLSMKFIMLINVKMPTIVGILTFISMLNETSESLKARKVGLFQQFSFISNWNFMLRWVEHEKSLITSGPWSRWFNWHSDSVPESKHISFTLS